MEIKVLGPGCSRCKSLEAAAREAVATLGVDATVEHVQDFERIAAYGVMTTPALVVDEQVRSAGRVLSAAQVAEILAGTG